MIVANVVEITPELAKQWLAQNTRNRKINPKAVADYARQMDLGLWELNGEAVKRAVDGSLLDGQHRLEAVVLAGASVLSLVIDGLPAAAQDTMDTGRKRSVSDMLSIGSVPNSTLVGAVARRAWMWDQGNFRFAAAQNPSIREALETIETYPHIHRSAEIAARTAQSYRPTTGSVTGMAHHLFVQLDPSLTAEFFAQLAAGADLKDDHPVLSLRTRLANDRFNSKRVPFHQGLGFYIRAWNARRAGESLSKIQYPADAPMIKPV